MPGTVGLKVNGNKATLSASKATEAVTYHITVTGPSGVVEDTEFDVNVNDVVKIDRTYNQPGEYSVRIEARTGNYKYRADFTIPTSPPMSVFVEASAQSPAT